MGTASRHQEKPIWFRQKEPLVACYKQNAGVQCYLVISALPWATSRTLPSQRARGRNRLGSTLLRLVTGCTEPPTSLGVVCDKI